MIIQRGKFVVKIVFYNNTDEKIDISGYFKRNDIITEKQFDSTKEIGFLSVFTPDIIIFKESNLPFGIDIFLEILKERIGYSPDIRIYSEKELRLHDLQDIISKKAVFEIINDNFDDTISKKTDFENLTDISDIKDIISGVLKEELKFVPYRKGFVYLKEAIYINILNPASVKQMFRSIYMPIAKKMNSTPQNIERSMRYSIQCGWDTSLPLISFFKFKRPPVALFIKSISEYIKERYRKPIQKAIEITKSCENYRKSKYKK